VSGVGGASAGVVVVNGAAQARRRSGALTLAGVHVVALASGAGGDDESASGGVVVQTALVSGVGGALASRRVPGGTAEAGLDLTALALADGVVGELSGQAQGRVDALTVALAVQLLEARAGVGALASTRDRVVDLVNVGAGSVDADIGGVAELEGSNADAVTAVVVVVGALIRDQGAETSGRADGVAGLEGCADTAAGSVEAAARGSDAPVGGSAVGRTAGAGQDASPVVGRGDVVLLADQTEELGGQSRAGLVNDAEGDQGQASLPITGGVVARAALGASPVQGHEDLTVGDDGPALASVGGQLVVSGAPGAFRRDSGVVLRDIGQAELNVGDTTTSILGQTVTSVADSAEVLISDVGEAVGDVDQAEVPVDGQPGKVFVALDTEAQAVVLQAVADASGDARCPVGRLGVAIGAVGAQVGPWDVGQAVGHDWQADAVHQHGRVVAGQADSAGSCGGVVDTPGDHGHDDADGSQTQVVPLDAGHAVAVGVDLGAGDDSAPHAVAVDQVVKLCLVTRHAVQVVGVPQDASDAGSGGNCRRVASLRVDLKEDQAKSKYEDLVHCLLISEATHLKRFPKQIRRLYD